MKTGMTSVNKERAKTGKASGKKVRVVFDVVLTLMILFEMFIQYTGDFLHEVVGFALFGTIVLHLVLSAKWMKSTARLAKSGRLSGRRIALAVMGVLLAIATIVLAVSSVAISNLLYSAGFVWALGSYDLWATIHSVSSYTLAALVVIHLGMHWAFLASAFKVPYNPSRRRAISTGVYAAAAVGAVALGIIATREALPQAHGAVADQDMDTSTTSSSSASSSQAGEKAFSEPVSDHGASSVSNNSAGSNQSKDDASNELVDDNLLVEYEEVQVEESYSESAAEAESEPAVITGYCTLCRKNCPLSAPQCDRPYQAGLL